MKRIVYSLFALHFLSFPVFGADDVVPNLNQRLCGAMISISKSGGPISVQIRGGKTVINEADPRELLERVTAKDIREFDMRGRNDDLEYLLASHHGQNLLLAKGVSPAIRALQWKVQERDPLSATTMVLSASVPAQNASLGENTFEMYHQNIIPSMLRGSVFLRFSSFVELKSAIASLNDRLNGRADSFDVDIDPEKLTLYVSEIDLSSVRENENFVRYATLLYNGRYVSGVKIFLYFLNKYGVKDSQAQEETVP